MDKTADADALGTGQAAPGTVVQPEKPVEDWQKRFAGLQGAYQKLQSEKTLLQAQLMEVQESATKATGDRDALDLLLKSTGEKATKAETELLTLRAQNARVNMLVTEFPELLPFYGDDLLPMGEGEELRKKLTAFREKLQSLGSKTADDARKSLVDGTPPPAPGGEKPMDASAVFQKAIAAMRAGNMAEYDKFYTEYLKLKPAK